MQDVRAAVRYLIRRPAFTIVAVVTLGLGIGASTAIFSVVNAVLVRPLDYREPDGLVQVSGHDARTGEPNNLSPADFLDIAREPDTFARTGAHGWVGFATITGDGAPERIGAVNVTDGFFPTLGVEAALGRVFTADEDRPNGPRVVVLSHGFWQRRFAGDPAIVGKTILLNLRPTEVVGVLPASYRHFEWYPDRGADVFLPWQFDPAASIRSGHFIRAVARLSPAASPTQTQARLDALAARLEKAYPDSNIGQRFVITPLLDSMVSDTRLPLLLLLGAVGLVLLIACANLANLLLASGVARQQELAIRMALGAPRRRLVRQLLTESLVVSTTGALLGLLGAFWATRTLRALGEIGVLRADEIRVDPIVLLFSIGVALATGLLFGSAPALLLTRSDSMAALKEAARGTSSVALGRALRSGLIVAEVALSLVLLVGAGLLMQSLWSLGRADLGFAASHVVTMQVALPTAKYAEGEQIPVYRRLYERLQALPGVQAVAGINILPLSTNYDSRSFQIEERPVAPADEPSGQERSASPDYFAAMGIPLVRGRLFTDRDDERAAFVAIISASLARKYWPGEDPIGRRITFNSGIDEAVAQQVGGPGSREIVGIVGDVKHLAIEESAVPMFYTPQAQPPSYHQMTVIVRAAVETEGVVAGVRRELAAIDPDVPLFQIRTLDDMVSHAVAQPRLRTWLLAVFAALSLLLSLVGVYGVVGYLVNQRRREVGLRLALGADPPRIAGMFLREGLAPVSLGVLLGLAGAAAATRLLTSLLFGIGAGDPTTYVATGAIVGIAALVASLIPALRATRIDPMDALRAE